MGRVPLMVIILLIVVGHLVGHCLAVVVGRVAAGQVIDVDE